VFHARGQGGEFQWMTANKPTLLQAAFLHSQNVAVIIYRWQGIVQAGGSLSQHHPAHTTSSAGKYLVAASTALFFSIFLNQTNVECPPPFSSFQFINDALHHERNQLKLQHACLQKPIPGHVFTLVCRCALAAPQDIVMADRG
jgi:hypothetical protein